MSAIPEIGRSTLPRVNFLYRPEELGGLHDDGERDLGWTPRTLTAFGQLVRPLIAEACSIDGLKLVPDDIDWIPCPYPPGTLVATSCAIEIETFGYPARIEKLSKERVRELKQAIVDIINEGAFVPNEADRKFFKVDPDQPLIWVKYLGPDGHHV